jgi:hypothetical protein
MRKYAGFYGNRLGNRSGFESLRSLHFLYREFSLSSVQAPAVIPAFGRGASGLPVASGQAQRVHAFDNATRFRGEAAEARSPVGRSLVFEVP